MQASLVCVQQLEGQLEQASKQQQHAEQECRISKKQLQEASDVAEEAVKAAEKQTREAELALRRLDSSEGAGGRLLDQLEVCIVDDSILVCVFTVD